MASKIPRRTKLFQPIIGRRIRFCFSSMSSTTPCRTCHESSMTFHRAPEFHRVRSTLTFLDTSPNQLGILWKQFTLDNSMNWRPPPRDSRARQPFRNEHDAVLTIAKLIPRKSGFNPQNLPHARHRPAQNPTRIPPPHILGDFLLHLRLRRFALDLVFANIQLLASPPASSEAGIFSGFSDVAFGSVVEAGVFFGSSSSTTFITTPCVPSLVAEAADCMTFFPSAKPKKTANAQTRTSTITIHVIGDNPPRPEREKSFVAEARDAAPFSLIPPPLARAFPSLVERSSSLLKPAITASALDPLCHVLAQQMTDKVRICFRNRWIANIQRLHFLVQMPIQHLLGNFARKGGVPAKPW